MLAVLLFGLYLLGVNVLLLLFGGAILFGVLRLSYQRWQSGRSQHRSISAMLPAGIFGLLRVQSGKAAVVVTGVAVAAAPFSQLVLFLTFLKLGAVVYGSGYTLLAFLHADLVQNLHWLTDKQLLDAVSIGQFTPGPVFTTATFIGYVLGGWPGALLATLGIFLPSFVLIPLIHPLAARLRQAVWTSALLDGANIAALALMAGVLFQLGQHALIDVWTWLLAIGALALLVRFKLNSVWLILVGAAFGLLRFWVLHL